MRVHSVRPDWEKGLRRLSFLHPLGFWLLVLLIPPALIFTAVAAGAVLVALPMGGLLGWL